MLPIVQEAVSRDRKLTFQYARAGSERMERSVDPLGLVAKGRTWYLVAQSPAGLRTYRVSRIEDARLLAEPADRPAGFDLVAYWKSSTREFADGWPRYHATLHMAPSVARRISRWRITEPASGRESSSADTADWIALRVQFDTEEEARFFALGLGPQAEVIDPPSLRERVAADAAAVLARLGRGQPRTRRSRGPGKRRARDGD
jgi:predicted DNA-binding transcriptional regulator YafY